MPLRILKDRASAVVTLLLGRRRRMVGISVLMCGLAIGGQAQSAGEYQVKAAFLFNFAKFVEWPPNAFPRPDAPLQICVLGQDPFGVEFEQSIVEKIVQGHKIKVVHPDGVPQARACQILFIASSEKQRMRDILQGLTGASVLTVADTPSFIQGGGIINFVLERDQVRFEINLRAAELAHLKLSARLLTVAKLVLPGGSAEEN
jgi:hypothetical protein